MAKIAMVVAMMMLLSGGHLPGDDINGKDSDCGGNDDVDVRRAFTRRLQKESCRGQDYPCTR